MTTIVAYQPGAAGLEALRLGAYFARSRDSRLLVTMVMETQSAPTVARVDFQYNSLLRQQLMNHLEEAQQDVPGDVHAEYRVHDARSVPSGLVELAESESAYVIVVGNASRGVLGRISLGSTTNHLVHSSPVPIALAPRGFRTTQQDRISRVTAAYGGEAGKSGLVVAAAGICEEMNAELRLASFSLQPRNVPTTDLEARSKARASITAAVRESAEPVLAEVRSLPNAPKVGETVVGFGEEWADAIEHVDWTGGDVLVVGSSDMGPGHRVFLGSTGMRIVHESPVPVIVLPGEAVETLVERAEEA
ncbi:universal stress protein [Flexivirga oryzae]|uniref:Nucleotide-binding universal stress UspA family protein n=1 Tax=Flexivirga oryzae TaxID=1794944 RepID=A0A839N2S8_9MICO|nr:universal stress protein [Flexivirga oryzae]MBB2891099.1 nucleotide-binding universal stress UspA family protein [Flexivirga oryzae]